MCIAKPGLDYNLSIKVDVAASTVRPFEIRQSFREVHDHWKLWFYHKDSGVVDVSPQLSQSDAGPTVSEGSRKIPVKAWCDREVTRRIDVAPLAADLDWGDSLGKLPRVIILLRMTNPKPPEKHQAFCKSAGMTTIPR